MDISISFLFGGATVLYRSCWFFPYEIKSLSPSRGTFRSFVEFSRLWRLLVSWGNLCLHPFSCHILFFLEPPATALSHTGSPSSSWAHLLYGIFSLIWCHITILCRKKCYLGNRVTNHMDLSLYYISPPFNCLFLLHVTNTFVRGCLFGTGSCFRCWIPDVFLPELGFSWDFLPSWLEKGPSRLSVRVYGRHVCPGTKTQRRWDCWHAFIHRSRIIMLQKMSLSSSRHWDVSNSFCCRESLASGAWRKQPGPKASCALSLPRPPGPGARLPVPPSQRGGSGRTRLAAEGRAHFRSLAQQVLCPSHQFLHSRMPPRRLS